MFKWIYSRIAPRPYCIMSFESDDVTAYADSEEKAQFVTAALTFYQKAIDWKYELQTSEERVPSMYETLFDSIPRMEEEDG